MKKLFFVFAIAMLVLFTVNLTLAEDNISILIKGIDGVRPLTDEECKKIGELIIPSSAKREVYKITTEELMLS
ncbi:hypothetical protein KJ761_01660, partial [Patescibacteria group bacterium]|nr:hypothetical protein [Patescibacteria group bacterium]